MSLNKYMHPRNPYRNRKPDFKILAEKYPEFCGHVIQDTSGKMFLDFKNPEALRVLTKTLLKEDFSLEVDLPSDRLVPTIPLRLNYILWIEDIIGKKKSARGIDIGTGSSCVYPLLGNRLNKWTFLATDVDAQNIFYAKKNVEKNDLTSSITVKKVTEDALITGALLDTDPDVTYDFCMCNPPFFADHMEAQAITTSRSVDRPEPVSISTASPKESIAKGGEVAFVKQLVTDSVVLRDRVRVYTSMIGKKTSLPALKEELRRLQVAKYATTEFCQGKTMRWGIAWTFDDSVVFPKSMFQLSKNEKPPLTYLIPFGAGGSIYDVLNLTERIKMLLKELQMTYKEKKCHKGFSSLSVSAFENTWSNQRRKRRQKMRDASDNGGDNSNVTCQKGDNSTVTCQGGDNSNANCQSAAHATSEGGDNSNATCNRKDNSVICQGGDNSKEEMKTNESIDCTRDRNLDQTLKNAVNSDQKGEMHNMDDSGVEMKVEGDKNVVAEEMDHCQTLDRKVAEKRKLSEKSADREAKRPKLDENVVSDKSLMDSGVSEVKKDSDDEEETVTTAAAQTSNGGSGTRTKGAAQTSKGGSGTKPTGTVQTSQGGSSTKSTDVAQASEGGSGSKPIETIQTSKGGSGTTRTNEGGSKSKLKRARILKFEMHLIKRAGISDIHLEMIWRDGDNRELLHQVMQYFKNKLKAPC